MDRLFRRLRVVLTVPLFLMHRAIPRVLLHRWLPLTLHYHLVPPFRWDLHYRLDLLHR